MEPLTTSLAISGAIGVTSGLISAWSARENAKRQNQVLEARKVILEQEKIYRRKVFRVQTFAEYWDAQEAGANRIHQALSSGVGFTSLSGFNMDHDAFERNKYLQKYAVQEQERRIDRQKGLLDMSKADPSKAFWRGFARSGVETGLNAFIASGGVESLGEMWNPSPKGAEFTYPDAPKGRSTAADPNRPTGYRYVY